MHALFRGIGSSLRWRQRPRISVGLDLGSEFTSWVILCGSQADASSVVCAERLALPLGWVEAGRIAQPTEMGLWLRQTLLERGWAAEVLSIGVDDAWITSHRVNLAQDLTQDDVLFQLMAEIQAARPDGAEVTIDYRVAPQQASAAELTYEVQSVPRTLVNEAQQLARAARLNLVSLSPRAQASSLAQQNKTWDAESALIAPLLAGHDVALGLALSAWTPAQLNWLPHRDTAHKAARLGWLRQASVCGWVGVSLAIVLVVTLDAMTDALQAKLTESTRLAGTRAHASAQQAHAQLTRMAQRANAQADWLSGQRRWQASTLAWHHLLAQPAPGVWVSHLAQKGVQWSVHGDALSSHHAQQWVQGWAALDIWAKPPQLPALQLTQTVSQQGVPVWQFQVEAELKEVR